MANRVYTSDQLREIVSFFQVFGDISAITPYGSGHINDTFKVDLSLGGSPVSYILQRVNDSIFTRPDLMMENILRVTAHIRAKFAGQSDATRRTLTVIPSRDGKGWARGPNGGWWRMYVFIAGARTVDLISEAGQAHKAARAFAEEGGAAPAVYDLRWLKPLDEALLAEIADRFGTILTVEDGARMGGLYGAVCEFVAGLGRNIRVQGLGIPDRFIPQASQQEERHACGLDAEGILDQLRKLS